MRPPVGRRRQSPPAFIAYTHSIQKRPVCQAQRFCWKRDAPGPPLLEAKRETCYIASSHRPRGAEGRTRPTPGGGRHGPRTPQTAAVHRGPDLPSVWGVSRSVLTQSNREIIQIAFMNGHVAALREAAERTREPRQDPELMRRVMEVAAAEYLRKVYETTRGEESLPVMTFLSLYLAAGALIGLLMLAVRRSRTQGGVSPANGEAEPLCAFFREQISGAGPLPGHCLARHGTQPCGRDREAGVRVPAGDRGDGRPAQRLWHRVNLGLTRRTLSSDAWSMAGPEGFNPGEIPGPGTPPR